MPRPHYQSETETARVERGDVRINLRLSGASQDGGESDAGKLQHLMREGEEPGAAVRRIVRDRYLLETRAKRSR